MNKKHFHNPVQLAIPDWRQRIYVIGNGLQHRDGALSTLMWVAIRSTINARMQQNVHNHTN